MIKKILLICVLILTLFIISGIVSKACPEDNINYIKESFKNFSKEFFERSEKSNEGMYSCNHISININNTIYYILVYTEGPFIKTITSIWAKKEVKFRNEIVEIYKEGIYKDFEHKYYYLVTHQILYRNSDCKEKQLKPMKIWDEVVNIWSEKLDR